MTATAAVPALKAAGLRKSSGDHVMLNEFLAERMPRLLEEWHAYRAKAESRD